MKNVIGWILTIIGGVYIAILGAQGLSWLVDRNPVEVHIPILIVSIILVLAGTVVRRGWK